MYRIGVEIVIDNEIWFIAGDDVVDIIGILIDLAENEDTPVTWDILLEAVRELKEAVDAGQAVIFLKK